MLVLWTRGVLQRWRKRTVVLLRTGIIILLLAKFFTAAVVVIELLRRLIAWSLNLIAGTTFNAGASMTMMLIALGAGTAFVLLLTYGMLRNQHRYRVRRVSLDIPQLHSDLEGLTVVHLSDIHCGSFLSHAGVRKGVNMARNLQPDLLLFTGDLVNYQAAEADPFIDLFGSIEATYGRYSICGNHDYGDYIQWPSAEEKKLNFVQLRRQHERIGWHLLLNAHDTVAIGDARIGIIGVENYSAHPRFQKYGDLEEATREMPEVDLRILLSHDPSHWSDQVTTEFRNIDLTLSGHTHGFQFGIDLGAWFRWSPVQYVYKQWMGLYQAGQQYLYVNRGFGFLGYPGRVGILPEITCITLSRKQGE